MLRLIANRDLIGFSALGGATDELQEFARTGAVMALLRAKRVPGSGLGNGVW